jgi:AAA family ATP:ADP antiporter
MTAQSNTDSGALSATERFLRLFTDVRAGEGRIALLLFADVFLILCSYYFVKPLREGWISVSSVASLSKMEVKAYSSFGQSLLLLPIVWYYGRLADRFHRRDLIARASLFCISNMVLFWLIQPDFFIKNLPGTGIAFYLWVGMFGVFVVAQFWAFAADVYTDEQGRRLIPMVAIGATAGAAMGSWITDVFVSGKIVPTGIYSSRDGALWRSSCSPAWSTNQTRDAAVKRPAKEAGQVKWRIDASSAPFLLTVGAITLLLSWVNTNGENPLAFASSRTCWRSRRPRGGVTGDAAVLEFTRDGTTAFSRQLLLLGEHRGALAAGRRRSRLLKYGGFGVTLLLLPVIALISYSTMWLLPVLAVVKAMKIAENSTDYSINNTARHVLWLPVSTEMKYKGKPAIDSLFVRVGDGLAALTVLIAPWRWRRRSLPSTFFSSSPGSR